jgi:hypothetical protein
MPSLRSLEPRFRAVAEAFFKDLRKAYPGAGFTITSAKRSRREQLRLYNEFLAGRNDGLPASPPGRSDHEMGLAFDMARLNRQPLDDDLLAEAGSRWERLGGVWGGRWKARDPVHFGVGSTLAKPAQRRKTRKATSSRRR